MQYDKQEVADVWELYGTIQCKVGRQSSSHTLQIGLEILHMHTHTHTHTYTHTHTHTCTHAHTHTNTHTHRTILC